MRYRPLGRTGLTVSEIGFGCGSQGGLMVRGERKDQLEAATRAIESGINYFDTAASYGDGESERNLGEVLRELKADVYVGTKASVRTAAVDDIKGALIRSVEGSLGRLGRDSVDLIQLHSRISEERRPASGSLSAEDVVEEAVDAFEALRTQGKTRFYGITGMGETAAVHRVIGAGAVYTVQTVYNLLNPSAGRPVLSGFYAQDFGGLLRLAAESGTGTIVIRALAAGALSGAAERHPVAGSGPPMGSSAEYGQDVEKAALFRFLVDEGFASDRVEAALRFVLSNPDVSIALVGFSSVEQVEQAVRSTEKGPLPPEVEGRLHQVWASWT